MGAGPLEPRRRNTRPCTREHPADRSKGRSVSTQTFWIDDVRVKQVGAIVDLNLEDYDPGVHGSIYDLSENKLSGYLGGSNIAYQLRKSPRW